MYDIKTNINASNKTNNSCTQHIRTSHLHIAMSNQNRYLLLKNGTALIHREDDTVDAIRTDVLISDSKISMVTPNIAPPPGSQVM